MGYYVHLHVVFACKHNDEIACLARRHLLDLSEDDVEAKMFLESLASRCGYNPGPKGGLSLWGIVGNYTVGGDFVEVLGAFWEDLLRGDIGGPPSLRHILVFVESEQSEAMEVYEIFLNAGTLIVQHHCNLPFCAYQM